MHGSAASSRYEEERDRQIANNKLRLQQLGVTEAADALQAKEVCLPLCPVTAEVLSTPACNSSILGETAPRAWQKPPPARKSQGRRADVTERVQRLSQRLAGKHDKAAAAPDADQDEDSNEEAVCIAAVRLRPASSQRSDPEALREHNEYR